LNSLGEQGWELVSVVLNVEQTKKYVAYLKRLKAVTLEGLNKSGPIPGTDEIESKRRENAVLHSKMRKSQSAQKAS
jgi:hypothetical protein